MKKTGFITALCVLIALCAGLAIPHVTVQASDIPNWRTGSTADNYVDYFSENGVWYLVTLKPIGSKPGQVYAAGATNGTKRVVIPASFKHSKKDYVVIGINDYAFWDDSTITSVEVKKGVTFIGEEAFARCSSLKTVKLADSVNKIGRAAFSDCKALKTVNIPAGIKKMEDAMFSECISLEKITVGKNVTEIGEGAFLGCVSLKNVTFNSKLKVIGYRAFERCESLADPKFPLSITKIGEEAFSSCKSLKNITLPKKVKTIERECFAWCDNLTTVKLPAQVRKIDKGSFLYCTSLKKVGGKNTKLTEIADDAFDQCEKLTMIKTPKVARIGEGAFYKTGIKKLTLKKLTDLGKSAFAYSKITEAILPGSLKIVPDGAFEMCKELQKAVLEDGVEQIDDRAFQGCTKMTSFSYPKSLKKLTPSSLERSAWLDIKLGKEITYNNVGDISYQFPSGVHAPDSFSVNGVCIYMNNIEYYKNQYGYEASQYKETIEFPAGTKVVACAFGTGNNCTKVVIPEGCEVIDGMINFEGRRINSDFTPVELVLPKSLKVITGLLRGDGLKKVNLPENLEVLGSTESNSRYFVFGDAKALEEVHFDGNKLKRIGNGCFSGTTSLTQVYLPEGIEEIGDDAFRDSAVTKVILPATLKKIGSCAFQRAKLTEIELPEGLEEIGGYAFDGAPLTLVTSPHKAKLGDGSCNLPSTVRTIGIGAFRDTELTKFDLPDNFEIKFEITDNRSAVMYVKKGSKAEKALKEFLKSYTDLWTVKRK